MISTITVSAWHEHAAHLPFLLGYYPGRAVVSSLIRGGAIEAVTCAALTSPTPGAAAEATRACWQALPRREHDEAALVVWADSHEEAHPLLQGVRSAMAPPCHFSWGGIVVGGHFQRDPTQPWRTLEEVDTSAWAERGIHPWKTSAHAEALLDDAAGVVPGGSAAVMRLWARTSGGRGSAVSAAVEWPCLIHTPARQRTEWAALLTRELQHDAALLREVARVLCDATSAAEGLFCCPCDSPGAPLTFLQLRWMIDGYARVIPLAIRHRWWLLQALAAYRHGELHVARAAAQRAGQDDALAGPSSLLVAAANRGTRSDPQTMLQAITTHFTATARVRQTPRGGRC